MGREVMDRVISVLGTNAIAAIDITGGAPELNPGLKYLVKEAKRLGRHVIVRSNLAVLHDDGMEGLPGFYRDNDVEVVASLPYYAEAETDRVRGKGTFKRCIEAIRTLNAMGYAQSHVLNLVYNPAGAFLAPAQAALEADYRAALANNFGVHFNKLYTFANMPIGRFRDYLIRSGNLDAYMSKLAGAFNPATLDGIMCRRIISVGPDGALYDCDFNLALGLAIDGPGNIAGFDYARLAARKIRVAEHCYACTAGQGST